MDFDRVIDRFETGSVKWDFLNKEGMDKQVIPMWIADMDLPIPQEVVKALQNRLEHPVFGYTMAPEGYSEALIKWYQKRFDYSFSKEDIVPIPGVVPGINYCLHALTDEGDGVIIQTPVYHQFKAQIINTKRRVIENPLIENGGYYEMDFEHLDKVAPQAKMLILCSPHNPVGRVWKREELKKLYDICARHDLIILSDEIHGDITSQAHKNVFFNAVDPQAKERTVIATAPNKTFNIAGFKTGNLIVENESLRDRIKEYEASICYSGHTILGNIAQMSAYQYGENWCEAMNRYIEQNIEYVCDYIAQNIPSIRVRKPEGTYLLWLDCRALGIEKDDLAQFFLNEAKILISQGSAFGDQYGGFVRMNVATRRELCEEAMRRLHAAVEQKGQQR